MGTCSEASQHLVQASGSLAPGPGRAIGKPGDQDMCSLCLKVESHYNGLCQCTPWALGPSVLAPGVMLGQ